MAISVIARMMGWLRRRNRSKKTDTGPAAGSIFSFRTVPFSEFSPGETGRFAAFKILGSTANVVTVAVLDGIWTTPPAYAEVSSSAILREHRFAAAGGPAAFGVFREWWSTEELKDVVFLGTAPLSHAEASIAARIENFEPGSSHSDLGFANYHAEGEWRWFHDREALLAEQGKAKAKAQVEQSAREEQHEGRLQHLTWDQLLAETPFPNWSPSPPYPPEDFTKAARNAIHQACRDLKALGPDPGKAAAGSVLQRCVAWFNDADARYGGVIETEEREGICAALEEMAVVAGHRSLTDEIDSWRDW
jgi:hypothetical protein